ncbi:MAG: hypothetical protein U1E65_00805 [Myxococcota bacterium]
MKLSTFAHLCAMPTLVLSTACGGSALESTADSIQATNVSGTQTPPPPLVADPCPYGQVTFNGKCRALDFFAKLVTDGATLLGVVGANSKSKDPGVVVVEGFGNGTIRMLWVEPTKVPATGPFLRSRLYHDNYPISHITSLESFVDPTGYAHLFTAELGSVADAAGLRFGLQSWSHRRDTASGYVISYSDGTSLTAIASSTGGDYCNSASAAAAVVSGGACEVGVAIDSLLLGANVAVWSSVLSGGLGTGEAIAVGGVVTGTAVTAGTAICGSIGALSAAVVHDECEAANSLSNATPLPNFVPYLPEVPSTPAAGMCPAGEFLYTGQVVYCYDADFVTFDGDEVTVTAGSVCDTRFVSNTCVVP